MADIDFGNADSRMKYLKENLGHLMGGIDKNYSQVIMDELMRRLEKTVSDFNEEVKAMLDKLQGVDEDPADILKRGSASQGATQDEGLSEFEKRLQALDD